MDKIIELNTFLPYMFCSSGITLIKLMQSLYIFPFFELITEEF